MSYFVSIDLETTGLNPKKHQIIEIGATLCNYRTGETNLDTFHQYVTYETLVGDPFALMMNQEIIERIAIQEEPYEYAPINKAMGKFEQWLHDIRSRLQVQKLNAAGKNFAVFDLPFLVTASKSIKNYFYRRYFDPAILYWQPEIDDELPDLTECLKRAGLPSTVCHSALEDAQQVAALILSHTGFRG